MNADLKTTIEPKTKTLFKCGDFFCPICNCYHSESSYLKQTFKDEKTRWLANMVTHYRHFHIQWWDNCWGRYGYKYRGDWFGDYDEEKRKVNESSKRQIFRKSIGYIKEYGIGIEHLCQLQNNEDKTIQTVSKLLTKKTK